MFAKVFASLWQGSMVGKSDVQLVFIYMLANCDAGGVFDQTPEVVSALTGLTPDRVREAIAILEAPDPRSRTSNLDGRRIVLLDDHRDWGWQIVNYVDYRNARDEEVRREQTREATKRWRAKQTVNEPDSSPMLTVSNVSHGEPTVSIGEHHVSTVSHGEPKQKQKQKQKQIEPAGSTELHNHGSQLDNREAVNLDATVATSPDPSTAARLVKYLRDSGTSNPGCIVAVLEHWHANRHKIDKPLAYYDRHGPARSAILMQHNMAIAERRQDELRRMRA
jgi:hypothetical protein